ncbi:Putative sugar kinase [Serinicoccus hydrothermalis]|uniref:Glucokinase n=1 Tax=Serinicoccus hydrothermalis TaxID=1758689 RepID=A0A1B1N9T3_9MICO|nr:ROK family glucokinase [Serinicoccus hydrothermalis]ANS78210.1 Putative sugar kinase [Serinicoccus hydrothermalis]
MSDLPAVGTLAVGVDVGGTHVKGGLVDDGGAILATRVRPTPGRTTPAVEVEGVIAGLVADLLGLAATRGAEVVAVGVGAAGFVDARRGTVVFAPHLAWRDEPLQRRLAGRLGRPVLVDNDAHAAAWAEHRFGAGRGESHLVVLTLGTGIGGAILVDGRLQRGRHGLAGEFGHQQLVPDGRRCPCGNRGCWEQYASAGVLARTAREVVLAGGEHAAGLTRACGGDPDAFRGEHVTQAAQEGDPAAREILADVGRWLGTGLAGVVAALDPGTVVVGGGASLAGELLLGPARETLARRLVGRGHRPIPTVVAAALGASAGLVGAADLARTAAHDRPGEPRG